jgi:hypothetical protein
VTDGHSRDRERALFPKRRTAGDCDADGSLARVGGGEVRLSQSARNILHSGLERCGCKFVVGAPQILMLVADQVMHVHSNYRSLSWRFHSSLTSITYSDVFPKRAFIARCSTDAARRRRTDPIFEDLSLFLRQSSQFRSSTELKQTQTHPALSALPKPFAIQLTLLPCFC